MLNLKCNRPMKDSGIEWIGKIPADWNIEKLKNYFSFGKGLPITKEDLKEFGIAVISYGQIHSKDNTGTEIKNELIRYVSDDWLQTNAQSLVNKGDFIFADTSEDLEGCGNCVFVDKKLTLFAGYHSIVLSPLNKNYSKYLAYLFKSDVFRSQIRSHVAGIKVFSITQRILKKLTIILPSNTEQQMIAKFLDKKCGHIDAILEKTKASIEDYKKLKQAVITQAVTKGIRPNRPMKNSGIEWIGEIPADWEVHRIKTLFNLRDERNTLPLEEVNLISLYTDIGVIQHSDIEVKTGNKASNADGYKKVYENDIVVNIILCWMGAIGRSAYNGVTSPAYDVYTPKTDVNSNYYHHYFRTTGFNGDCYKGGRGIMAMRWRTYSDQFRDIRVAVPSAEEQQEIVDYLDTKCTEIDKLIEKKEQLVSELETYKKSLIYEYVTGKKEAV